MIVVQLQLLHLLNFVGFQRLLLHVLFEESAALRLAFLVLLRKVQILYVRVFLNLFQRNPDFLQLKAVHIYLFFRHFLNDYLLFVVATNSPEVAG